jgi:hypothetical protein
MNDKQGGYVELRLYRHPSGAALNPGEVVERLKNAFPEVAFLPGDQLGASVARIEEATADERALNPASPLHHVLESERRKARMFGPAYMFRVPNDEPRHLWGRVRRYDITFLYDTPLDEVMQRRIVAFLQSFGAGWIEQYLPDTRQPVLLHDLNGNGIGPDTPSPSSFDVPGQGTKTA